MLAAEGLIEALVSEENSAETREDYNDDKDFGKVLDWYSSGSTVNRGLMLTYSDGTQRAFSFDD